MTERYRVEPTGRGFWPFCVVAGDGTLELFIGHRKSCEQVAAELTTAFMDGEFVGKRDYDALHAEAEALRANIVRLTSNPADHRYWEGRYRDAEAGLEVARGLLLEAKRLRNAVNIYPGRTACAWADSRMDERIDAFLTATPAPEAPVVNQQFTAEQGERQEAVCMRSVGHWGKSLAAIWPEDEAEQDGPWVIGTIDEDGNKYPVVSIDADQYDAPGDSKLLAEKLQALWAAAFTTPQPGPDVRGLVEALEGVVKRCSRSGYVGVDGQYLKVINAALAAHRQAQQGGSHDT